MLMGNLAGLVNGTEQIVFDYEVTGSAVSSISTGNILNGNEDGWYTILFRNIASGGSSYPFLRFNGDTGSNYGRRGIFSAGSSVNDWNGSSETGMYFGYTSVSGRSACVVARIYAKSGAVRLVEGIQVHDINGTSILQSGPYGAVWNNSADNLISMSLTNSSAYIGVGSRLTILKSNNFTNGIPTGIITTPYIKGAWTRIGRQKLTSAASSVTFTGLDGDRDVIYFWTQAMKGDASSPDNRLRLNNNTGSIYGMQALRASNTTVSADQEVYSFFNFYMEAMVSSSNMMACGLMFAKTGFVRPIIVSTVDRVSGTTITDIMTKCAVMNDTTNNITQFNFYASSGNWVAGSFINLYALRPNG